MPTTDVGGFGPVNRYADELEARIAAMEAANAAKKRSYEGSSQAAADYNASVPQQMYDAEQRIAAIAAERAIAENAANPAAYAREHRLPIVPGTAPKPAVKDPVNNAANEPPTSSVARAVQPPTPTRDQTQDHNYQAALGELRRNEEISRDPLGEAKLLTYGPKGAVSIAERTKGGGTFNAPSVMDTPYGQLPQSVREDMINALAIEEQRNKVMAGRVNPESGMTQEQEAQLKMMQAQEELYSRRYGYRYDPEASSAARTAQERSAVAQLTQEHLDEIHRIENSQLSPPDKQQAIQRARELYMLKSNVLAGRPGYSNEQLNGLIQ